MTWLALIAGLILGFALGWIAHGYAYLRLLNSKGYDWKKHPNLPPGQRWELTQVHCYTNEGSGEPYDPAKHGPIGHMPRATEPEE